MPGLRTAIIYNLWQCFSKWESKTAGIRNSGVLIKNANPRSPPMLLYRISGSVAQKLQFNWLLKRQLWGFLGGAVFENLPANAGDTVSRPGLGRSHMPRSNWAREPQLLSLRVWSLCSATREATTVRGPRTAMKSGPHLSQLEKALTQKRRPNTAINK